MTIGEETMAEATIPMLISQVAQTSADTWQIQFGGDGDDEMDKTWLTVHRAQIGREPRVGDILHVLPPRAVRVQTLIEYAAEMETDTWRCGCGDPCAEGYKLCATCMETARSGGHDVELWRVG